MAQKQRLAITPPANTYRFVSSRELLVSILLVLADYLFAIQTTLVSHFLQERLPKEDALQPPMAEYHHRRVCGQQLLVCRLRC